MFIRGSCLRRASANVAKVGGAGRSRTTAAPVSVRGAISGRQAPSVKSVKRSARALWVVKVVSLRAKCVAASGRRLTCLHTECRNGRHGGSSPVSRPSFCCCSCTSLDHLVFHSKFFRTISGFNYILLSVTVDYALHLGGTVDNDADILSCCSCLLSFC